MPHQILLLKLNAHCIENGLVNWIEKWLIDRRQNVVVDGEVSNWNFFLSGVPLGSVLGPNFFLICINLQAHRCGLTTFSRKSQLCMQFF